MAENRPAAAAVTAWLSLAITLSVQGGVAIWWAGVINTRVVAVETAVRDLQRSAPTYHDNLVANQRAIAVIDQRLLDIVRRVEASERALADLRHP